MQKYASQAEQEIAQLKENLIAEAGKLEKSEKLAHDLQESVLKVIENFEAARKEFTEHKEARTLRAKTAEQKLKVAEEELAGIKSLLNKICEPTFGKLASFYSLQLKNPAFPHELRLWIF